MASIFWYDLETTGTDPILDRAVQFAGIRTDEDLNETGEVHNFFGQIGRDVLPSPGAFLVTRIRMSQVQEQGLKEREFASKILDIFSESGTCVAGFNNLRFDDEFTRQMLYRNFHDPYAREWQRGNSRWDVIDFFRMAYALRPEGFEWAYHEPGLPSFRLEDMTAANGIGHADAHDALADVRATIAVTKRLRSAQPKLYQYLFGLRNKKNVLQQLYPLGKQAVVHVSAMYGAARGCTAVVLPVCQHPTNSNAIICVDLTEPVDDLLSANPAELGRLLFSRSDDLKEGELRPAVKLIHINRCPAVAPMNTLNDAAISRLGIDLSECESSKTKLNRTAGIVEKLQEVYSNPLSSFDDPEDPDFQLYGGGFFADADRRLMAEVCSSGPNELAGFKGTFMDDRLDEMLLRLRARNYPDTLSTEESDHWQEHCRSRLEGNIVEVREEIETLIDQGEDKLVLTELLDYVNSLDR